MNLIDSNATPNSLYSPAQIEIERVRIKVEKEKRARYASSFQTFVSNVRPSFQWYKHCDVLGEALERVARHELRRLMIFMPPRSGKSEQTSRLFPAYYLYNNPEDHFAICSYSGELALGLSRDARDNYTSTGRLLSSSAEAASEWHTHLGGRCWASGVGGPMAGRGAHVLLVDDAIRNEEEAYSLSQREKVWQWYQHTAYPRLEPNSSVVIINTRWHQDDLSGRILNEEKHGDVKENWEVINFQAVKDEMPQDFPKSCTIAVDWRKPGEPLCPERFDLAALNRIKSTIGDRAWRALFQQNPLAEGGNVWKIGWFQKYNNAHLNTKRIETYNDGADWDLAYGDEKEENSASAMVRSSLGRDGNIYVSDCDFRWLEFPDQIDWMKTITAPHYCEAKASGKSAVQSLRKAGVFAREVQVKGADKVSRTILSTPLAEQGKVFIHESIWEKLLNDPRQGILGFPARAFDDLNDAFVQALNRHWPRERARDRKKTEGELFAEVLQKNLLESHGGREDWSPGNFGGNS